MKLDPRRPRLGFYRRLSRVLKEEYDRSDAIRVVPLPPHPALGQATNQVVAALTSGEPARARRAAQELVDRICDAFVRPGRQPAVPHPRIKVLRTRPRSAGGEFHGLYTLREGEPPEIRVWMFTAAHGQVVKPRTFLRTLLHEVCHHLDITRLDLPSSLHTPGFHARESSLVRVLERSGGVIPGARRPMGGRPEEAARAEPMIEKRPVSTPRRRQAKPEAPKQLDLF